MTFSLDQPIFRNHLQDQVNAMIFPAASIIALATAIQTLSSQPLLYAKLSLASAKTWHQLQVPVKFAV